MASVKSGVDPVVLELAKALGLPKHTRSFEVRCAVDEVVTVKCEYFPEIDGVRDVVAVLAEYELWPKGCEPMVSDNTVLGDEYRHKALAK